MVLSTAKKPAQAQFKRSAILASPSVTFLAHHPLDQQLVADEVTGQERRGEQPVDHRDLPLKEHLVMDQQGQAAENR